jgi:hypothetical protein
MARCKRRLRWPAGGCPGWAPLREEPSYPGISENRVRALPDCVVPAWVGRFLVTGDEGCSGEELPPIVEFCQWIRAVGSGRGLEKAAVGAKHES